MREDGQQRGDGQPGWVDRHLGKIVAVALVLCLLGLVARALFG